eukprot:m.196992 g.196992  ORF g.196992 m.196992 type:complete len:442 (-) comp10088_c0_seq15:2702-4027(-)
MHRFRRAAFFVDRQEVTLIHFTPLALIAGSTDADDNEAAVAAVWILQLLVAKLVVDAHAADKRRQHRARAAQRRQRPRRVGRHRPGCRRGRGPCNRCSCDVIGLRNGGLEIEGAKRALKGKVRLGHGRQGAHRGPGPHGGGGHGRRACGGRGGAAIRARRVRRDGWWRGGQASGDGGVHGCVCEGRGVHRHRRVVRGLAGPGVRRGAPPWGWRQADGRGGCKDGIDVGLIQRCRARRRRSRQANHSVGICVSGCRGESPRRGRCACDQRRGNRASRPGGRRSTNRHHLLRARDQGRTSVSRYRHPRACKPLACSQLCLCARRSRVRGHNHDIVGFGTSAFEQPARMRDLGPCAAFGSCRSSCRRRSRPLATAQRLCRWLFIGRARRALLGADSRGEERLLAKEGLDLCLVLAARHATVFFAPLAASNFYGVPRCKSRGDAS